MHSTIKSSDVSVVVQGPIDKKFTPLTLASIRRFLPDAELILSTWKGSDVSGLSYDVLVENEDPGFVICNDLNGLPSNINRMIVSTKEGIKKATRPYTLKFRSDMVLLGNQFLMLFDLLPQRTEKWKFLKHKVLNPALSPNPRKDYFCFHPNDWFFFGLTEDVLDIWDIPLAVEPLHSRFFENHPRPFPDPIPGFLSQYVNEQYIWLSFLRKYVSIDFDHLVDRSCNYSLQFSELSIVNNLVYVPYEALQIEWLKNPIKNRKDMQRFYTFDEFSAVTNLYCSNGGAEQLFELSNGLIKPPLFHEHMKEGFQ